MLAFREIQAIDMCQLIPIYIDKPHDGGQISAFNSSKKKKKKKG